MVCSAAINAVSLRGSLEAPWAAAIPGTSRFRSVCSSESVLAESQSVRKWWIGDLSCSRECVLAKESLALANAQRQLRVWSKVGAQGMRRGGRRRSVLKECGSPPTIG